MAKMYKNGGTEENEWNDRVGI